MEEFNLSEKIWDERGTPIIYPKDVKEFIRLLKSFIINEAPNRMQIIDKLDELAGNKLK